MFSKSCEYAIRAVIIICQNSQDNGITNVKELSERAEVPEPYIAKIMQILSKTEIVKSIKGPGGGFFMDKEHKALKIIDIVIAIDGEELFTRCGLGLKECSEKYPCPLHRYFKSVRGDLRKMLTKTTIKELAEGLKNKTFHNLT